MKITSIETPVWGEERNYLFVVVDTDEGLTAWAKQGLTGRELAVTGTIERRPSYTWLGAPWSIRSRRARMGAIAKAVLGRAPLTPITSHQPGGGLSEHAHGADR